MPETPTKFTQEIKDNWLTALKSGKYKQGFVKLHRVEDNSYCCIGVLADIIEGLDTHYINPEELNNPYNFLKATIGHELLRDLYSTNDEDHYTQNYSRDYSNVIPLIEQLPVQE